MRLRPRRRLRRRRVEHEERVLQIVAVDAADVGPGVAEAEHGDAVVRGLGDERGLARVRDVAVPVAVLAHGDDHP